MKTNNGFWKVCEALDSILRLELLKFLIEAEKTEFPCVNELAERFDITSAAMSVHLKKLSSVGLVSMKRADRRVYYRAFPTTEEGSQVIDSLRELFLQQVDEKSILDYCQYAHALSHFRRHELLRSIANEPSLSVAELALATDMPPQTVDRLWGDLAKVGLLSTTGQIMLPQEKAKRVLLNLSLV